MMDTLIDRLGVQVVHAWGMTEMSPLGTACTLLAKQTAMPQEAQRAVLRKQGHAICGVDMKIVDDGTELPWDGATYGHLLVKGPWVVSGYFRGEGGDVLQADCIGVQHPKWASGPCWWWCAEPAWRSRARICWEWVCKERLPL